MKIFIGNPWAIEAYIDGDAMLWRSVGGERVTEFYYPDAMPEGSPDLPWTPASVASSVIGQISYHMKPGNPPPWIESDNPLVAAILCDHFGVDPKRKRPKTWGDGMNGPYEPTAAAKKKV
jgi:hypothetical protein